MCNDFADGYLHADPKIFSIVSSGCHRIVARLSASNTPSACQNHPGGYKSAIALETTSAQNRNQPGPLRYGGRGPTEQRWRRRWKVSVQFTFLHLGDLVVGIAEVTSFSIKLQVLKLSSPIRKFHSRLYYAKFELLLLKINIGPPLNQSTNCSAKKG